MGGRCDPNFPDTSKLFSSSFSSLAVIIIVFLSPFPLLFFRSFAVSFHLTLYHLHWRYFVFKFSLPFPLHITFFIHLSSFLFIVTYHHRFKLSLCLSSSVLFPSCALTMNCKTRGWSSIYGKGKRTNNTATITAVLESSVCWVCIFYF